MGDKKGAVKATEYRGGQVAARIEKLFEDPKYSDLTVVCEDRTWHVHKNIVCTACPFFEKASTGEFMEAKSQTVHLKNDPPTAVHEMLRYLYTGDYEETNTGVDGPGALTFNLLMHTIADKYDIPSLCELANERFAVRVAKEWDQDTFAEAIEELYTGPDAKKNEMMKNTVELAVKNAMKLFDTGHDTFHKAAETTPKFAADMARELAQIRPHHVSVYRCPNSFCGKILSMHTVESDPWDWIRFCTCCYSHFSAAVWKRNLVRDR